MPTESTDRPASQPISPQEKRVAEVLFRLGYVYTPKGWLFLDPPGPTEQELHNAKRLKIRGWWAGLAIIVTLGVVLACIIAFVWNALKLPYPILGG